MNQKETLATIKALRGMTARVRDGEYRVTFAADHIAAIMPHLTAREVQDRAEAVASYTNDAADALATAKRMAYDGFRISPAEVAHRNAQQARQRGLDGSGGRAFDPAKPFRAFARTPVSSTNWDFATLAEAREYLAEQISRAEFIRAGAAPAGPRCFDPYDSFIVWAGGVETLADAPWNYQADDSRDWHPSPDADGVTVGVTGPDWEPTKDSRWYAQGPATDADKSGPMAFAATPEAARAKLNPPATVAADEPKGRQYIDMTPTWAEIVPTLRMLVENGNAEGRRTAWEQIGKAAELADERNEMAKELARRESADLSDVIQEYTLRGDGCQAPGAIVLRRLDGNDVTPFVVHFRNDQDSERTGRPCYYFGDYCTSLADGWRAFADKVARYDPTGALCGEAV
jgi:hypothetical protein